MSEMPRYARANKDAEIRALKERIADLEKDAQRYRWLRGDGCNVVWMAIDMGECLGALDATIDAAMQKRA